LWEDIEVVLSADGNHLSRVLWTRYRRETMSLIAGNLGAVQRLLDDAGLTWGVCAGAAVYVYGVRRPIRNVDVLLPSGRLREVRDLLRENKRAVQYDGRILLWRGIKLFDDLSVTAGGRRYPFMMDQLMEEHLRRLPLLGSRVLTLSPEDLLAHKALLVLEGGESPGQHHLEDFKAIVGTQRPILDLGYLRQRMHLCGAEAQTEALFEEVGLSFPS
jgi:hypothetical protein